MANPLDSGTGHTNFLPARGEKKKKKKNKEKKKVSDTRFALQPEWCNWNADAIVVYPVDGPRLLR